MKLSTKYRVSKNGLYEVGQDYKIEGIIGGTISILVLIIYFIQ